MGKRLFKSKPVGTAESQMEEGTAESQMEEGTKRSSDVQYHSSFNFLGPPNLQLNVSSGQFSWMEGAAELVTATVFALVLQLSLLVIAAVTVYHEPTQTAIGYNPRPYGLPSYVVGSVSLFIGMAICSAAIEGSTAEFMWERRGKDDKPTDRVDVEAEALPGARSIAKQIGSKHPRLIWLQKSQTVNDQAFDSYAILGGSKRYVLTSSRKEDVKACKRRKTEKTPSKPDNAHRCEMPDIRTGAVAQSESESKSDKPQQQIPNDEDEYVSFSQRYVLMLC
jgi:hypothetical protein